MGDSWLTQTTMALSVLAEENEGLKEQIGRMQKAADKYDKRLDFQKTLAKSLVDSCLSRSLDREVESERFISDLLLILGKIEVDNPEWDAFVTRWQGVRFLRPPIADHKFLQPEHDESSK